MLLFFDVIANQTFTITLLTGASSSSAQSVIAYFKHVRVNAIVLSASLIKQALKDSQIIDFITSRVEIIIYEGKNVCHGRT